MQPNLQTDIQIMTDQQGKSTISPKGDYLKGNVESKGGGNCFLGMLNKAESVPEENIIDLKKLHENSQPVDGMLGLVLEAEQGTGSPAVDAVFKEANIAELPVGTEQDREVNEGKQARSIATEHDLLKGQINGNKEDIKRFGNHANTEREYNATDKSAVNPGLKAESDSSPKKSALSETVNLSVNTEENEVETWKKESNKNNAGFKTSKSTQTDVGKKSEAQLLHGSVTGIAKTIKGSGAKGIRADVQTNDVAVIKDIEKTTAAERIWMEDKTFSPGAEESKMNNGRHIFDNDIKDSEFNKKDFVVKMLTGAQKKEEDSDSSKRNHTSEEKTSQQDKQFIQIKNAGLKIKTSGTEFSAGKMIQLEAENNDNAITSAKDLSGEKSLEELAPGRENRLTSSISSAGTLKQIVQKAALKLKNGKSEAKIDLKPDFLGSVRMKITTENQMVRVQILTELPVVKEMIESNISQLKTDLQSHGLQIDKLDVSVANDSHQQDKGFEKTDFLSEQENKDVQDNQAIPVEESATSSTLEESTAENGLDFFA